MPSRYPLQFALRLPRRQVLEEEHVRRGQTVRFEVGCADLSVLYSGGAEGQANTPRQAEPQRDAIARYMMAVRCLLFDGSNRRELIPHTASDFCAHMSSKSGKGIAIFNYYTANDVEVNPHQHRRRGNRKEL
ncbi:unnamed protein product [Polarella glacialis]|uniref:Uncharacterized protein n=1 Tax=Polarella glacialis TaxID=89957 RepID=A0A813EFS1_POLGL|nr:unnamed protein product [Polarella glacialis]